ncbi:MAG: serine hydrolase [Clostridium sp.]|nr:serine hydrolase [Clostridium sp.]
MKRKKWKIHAKQTAALAMAFSLMLSGAASAAPIPPDGSGAGQTAQGGDQTSQGSGQTPGQHGQQATGPAGPGSGGGNSGSASRLPSLSGTVTTSQDSQTSQNGAQTGSQGSSQAAVPQIKAEGAVLYDATRDQVLYEKNADTRYYPASITKIMTALLVLEHCNLNDTVTFSQTAVTNLESGAVTLGVKAGDQFTVEQCLYGLLLKSANEIANGLAEHVSGSISGFADLMNQKAASLGCTNTHFVNPNGLNDSNHYTTARDMALIADAAFSNPTLCKIASTVNYDFPATASVPSVRKLTMGHKMVNPANSEYYSGIVGGKTGYTSLAGNTLVTCAERNGTRLVAVILKSRQTHYADTRALLDYGFSLVQSGGSSSGTGGSGGGPGSQQGPGGGSVSSNPHWVEDSKGWRFVKADGSYAANECMEINGEIYCFKPDSYIVSNDWYQIGGIWYFFRPSGGLAKSRWIETGGKWYYVDGNGSLFTNGTTPDGYQVDANGVWIQ